MLIKLQRKSIEEHYTAPNGKTTVITLLPDGSATLTAHMDGKEIFSKQYPSRRGAVAAMGRRFGRCRFSHMIDTISTRRVPK